MLMESKNLGWAQAPVSFAYGGKKSSGWAQEYTFESWACNIVDSLGLRPYKLYNKATKQEKCYMHKSSTQSLDHVTCNIAHAQADKMARHYVS